MTYSDPYGSDVLSGGQTHRRRPAPQVPVSPGLVVEDVESGFVGAVVGLEKSTAGRVMILEDRRGRKRPFPLGPGYLIDGRAVEITRPAPRRRTPQRTASGSRAVEGVRPRVARGSRIWVEGRHDAELVERIWGEDLRIEGVVVEPLGGLDDLPERLAEFAPDAEHRVGVLADHMIAGTKEQRIADSLLSQSAYRGVVRIIGHPFVDVWQAVRPQTVGIRAWPEVPRGEEWKAGICRRLGWPAEDHRDIAAAWQRILRSVRTIADVEPTLSGRVEELIDFVTVNRH